MITPDSVVKKLDDKLSDMSEAERVKYLKSLGFSVTPKKTKAHKKNSHMRIVITGQKKESAKIP